MAPGCRDRLWRGDIRGLPQPLSADQGTSIMWSLKQWPNATLSGSSGLGLGELVSCICRSENYSTTKHWKCDSGKENPNTVHVHCLPLVIHVSLHMYPTLNVLEEAYLYWLKMWQRFSGWIFFSKFCEKDMVENWETNSSYAGWTLDMTSSLLTL